MRVGRRTVVLDVVCPAWPGRRCTLDVAVRAHGRVLAQRRLRRLTPGTHRTTLRVRRGRRAGLRALPRIGVTLRPVGEYTVPGDTVAYSVAP